MTPTRSPGRRPLWPRKDANRAALSASSEKVVVVPSQRSAGPSGYMSADSTRYTLKLVIRTSRADGLRLLPWWDRAWRSVDGVTDNEHRLSVLYPTTPDPMSPRTRLVA